MMVTLLLLFFKLGKFDTLTVSFSIISPPKMYLSHAINMFFSSVITLVSPLSHLYWSLWDPLAM